MAVLSTVLAGEVLADVAADLDSLNTQDSWGEISFQNGKLRQVKVEAVDAEFVTLLEVVGALQIRPARYPLSEIRSVRHLGPRRIKPRMSPSRGRPSAPIALGLELLIPGAGYLYSGNTNQGWRVLLASAALGGVAMSSGENSAAAWMPLGVWLKLYSLHHLADEISATRAIQGRRSRLMARNDSTSPIFGVRWRF
ncbi:MAG: hypothetical protein HOM68_26555 [Gemmatimonadetes bacterium]|jgi:hypothetical protein|nr:hypothetical protein [Gemmatimonadota bacterium]MBT5060131.1 hypothetical protein [Gemmatimonadota bacterium]MBT5143761.1 hypothetical protein [Gemmatimonadota bacterium]MBT5590528.1 hypothetical protein [Gemmatimonadota bacterium]MBT5965601.1 hypothetical protein [Gemmatimonadota bacterium]